MTRQPSAAPRILDGLGVRLALGAVLTALAIALAYVAWGRNLEQACTLKQWPELPSCLHSANDVPLQVQALHQRIARNPGDSAAWIDLAVLSSQPVNATGLNHNAVLDTATQLAGEDYRLQRLQAARAIQLQQWPHAVDWLVRMVQDNSNGSAAVALAALMREPQALAAMQTHIKPGARWLGPVISAMSQAGVPVVLAMPLVVKALPQQSLSPELTQGLLRQLKADGQWLEAHALWTAWLGHPVPLLFNGDFDQGFIAGGFDWEVTPVSPSKAGALVRQVALDKHGGVLQVEFTGRPVDIPVVRQSLVLLHKRFVFSGQFMATNLRVNEGLTWVLQCVNDKREIARTPALKDTAGQWQPFAVEFELTPGCGQAASLQLQTFAPYEAATGLRGQVSFDSFKLEARP